MTPTPPSTFQGPFASGPPLSAVEPDAPSLTAFRFEDVGRFVVVAAVLAFAVASSAARDLVRRRGVNRQSLLAAVSDGLIDGCIRLGPTFVKAGQIIASSGALFPSALVGAARRCLDEVPPFPTALVRATVEEDLGLPIDQLFDRFDDDPLSAASVGQVHSCPLRDGREAVIKVQRPGIRRRMAVDLRNAYRIAWLIERMPWGKASGARGIIADLHAVTFQELNPAREAWQQDRFRSRIGAFGDNVAITAPEVYWDYCGPQVICMERVSGVPMDDCDELERRGIDVGLVIRRGAKVWAEAAMVHGPFHGDMHAGNIWVLDDGRGCFLDFGIMGELDPEWRELLRDLFYTCAFDLDFSRVAHAYQRVGALPPEFGDIDQLAAFLTAVIGPMLQNGFGSIDITVLVTESVQMLRTYGASIPRELALIAKQLFYIDRYTKHLAADYSITSDPFILKNIFPEEAKARAAALGVSFPD